MAKHEAWQLKQMQSLPLDIKIEMSKIRIREWYEYWDGNVYVSFSGGKDSTVLKHIVDSMYDDIPAVFVNTGLEYMEIQNFVKSIEQGKHNCFNFNIEILRPEMQFTEVIKKYGYPVVSKEVAKNVQYARSGGENNYHYKKLFGTYMYKGEKSRYCSEKWKYLYDAPFNVSAKCCDIMKKNPIHKYEKETNRKPITGTMAQESALRRGAWLKTGCNAFLSGRPRSAPLSFWTEQDVLHYIKKYNVPYAPVYGDIVEKKTKEDLKGQMSVYDILGIDEDVPLETTGAKRTGCIFCMFGCHLEDQPNRFQRLKETHPRQYDYCINGGEMVNGKWQPNKEGLGLGKVLDFIGVDYK